jgi:hypothetical protein
VTTYLRKSAYKKKKFGFMVSKTFRPGSVGPVTTGIVVKQHVMAGSISGIKLLTSWCLRSKKRWKEATISIYPLKTHINNLTSTRPQIQKVALPSNS